MIGKLKGLIDSYGEDHVIIDVQGVGYVVQCSARTLQRLPQPGEAAALSIETHVREDAIRLYGFMSDVERDWFRLMQVVQGVGAKVALAILSTLDPGVLATAIATNDKAAIARAPASARSSPSASAPSSRTRPRPSAISIRAWPSSRARSKTESCRSRSQMPCRRSPISAILRRRRWPPWRLRPRLPAMVPARPSLSSWA